MPERRDGHISRREFLQMFIAALGGALSVALGRNFLDSLQPTDKPQGFWEIDPTITGTRLYAQINAYSLHPDYAIREVRVTITDPQGHWETVCILDPADLTNTYICDVDIGEYIGNREAVLVSFNVESTNGKVSRAPNGEQRVEVKDELTDSAHSSQTKRSPRLRKLYQRLQSLLD